MKWSSKERLCGKKCHNRGSHGFLDRGQDHPPHMDTESMLSSGVHRGSDRPCPSGRLTRLQQQQQHHRLGTGSGHEWDETRVSSEPACPVEMNDVLSWTIFNAWIYISPSTVPNWIIQRVHERHRPVCGSEAGQPPHDSRTVENSFFAHAHKMILINRLHNL